MLSRSFEAMEKALAELGIYVGVPTDPERNLPNYKVDTREGLKWGTTDEFEQKAMSATFTVYFMKDHRNDKKSSM